MAVRKKRSISMPPDLDAEIAAAAADAGLSYSAWLADTARREFTIRAGLAVEPLDVGQARSAGALAARAATSDIVDACVVRGHCAAAT